MASRIFHRLIFRVLVLVTLGLVLLNEFLLYDLNKSSWQKIDCISTNCTRILLIADPQLIGKEYEKSFYSSIARYDSDRYLRKTFERSVISTRPNIIVFLGDLLDEGEIATKEDFLHYVKRFHNIYSTEETIRRIHIPGDNDIGGENGQYIPNSNVRRFEENFMQDDIFENENNIRFFKINRMLLDFTNPDKENNFNRLRIAISHIPILIGGGPLLRSVLKDLDPHVIFSAHWHESRIFVHPSSKSINFNDNAVQRFDLRQLKEVDHSYLEIMVPTCSYRMGTTKIGIGFAVIDNTELRYTVLWLPNRFISLLIYFFWLLLIMCYFIVLKMMTNCPFRAAKRKYSRSQLLP